MAAERAVNFAMRVKGVNEAQRDFMAVGQAAQRSIGQIQTAATAQASYQSAVVRSGEAAAKFGAAQAQSLREISAAGALVKDGAISQEEYATRVLQSKSALTLVGAEYRRAATALGASARAVVEAGEGADRYAGRLDALRAKYVPLFASGQQYKAALAEIRAAHAAGALSADEMTAAVTREKAAFAGEVAAIRARGQAVSALNGVNGAARAGFQQLGYQINDVTTQLATGTPVAQVFAQQSGQVIQSFTLMASEGSVLARVLGGPWGLAIVTGVSLLGLFASKLLDTKEGLEKVQFASDAMGNAQSILGTVIDLTTGKINTQNTALIALARAQLAVAKIKSETAATEARSTIAGTTEKQQMVVRTNPNAWFGGAGLTRAMPMSGLIGRDFLSGKINTDEAIKRLEAQRAAGKMSDDRFAQLASAYANLGAEQANQKVYGDAEKMLNGEKVPYLLKPGKDKKSRKDSGPSAADIAARFDEQRAGIMQQYNSALAGMASSAEQEAEYQLRNVELTRIRNVAEVQGNKDYSEAQKRELVGQYEQLADIDREKIARAEKERLAQERLRLDGVLLDNQRDLLNGALNLVRTSAERRDIQLTLLEYDRRQEKAALEATIASEASNDAAKAEARARLANLDKNYSLRAQGVKNQNAPPAEGFLRDLNRTKGEINEQIQSSEVRALQSLNDGITDAIVNFRSLGDVAQSVLKQITTDLVRMQVEQMITKPLAKALFPKEAATVAGDTGAGAASAGLTAVATASDLAARSLGGLATRAGADKAGTAITDLGSATSRAGMAMQELVPITGQFGGALGQAIAMLSSGGGGGGGILGSVLSIGGSLLGGGLVPGVSASFMPSAGLVSSAGATISANPALFASGTDDLPVGRPFWVGENGRELMERTRGGNLRVHSNQQAHRMAEHGGGGITVVNNNYIPERTDPRRPISLIARATQGGIARAARKGLATAGSF